MGDEPGGIQQVAGIGKEMVIGTGFFGVAFIIISFEFQIGAWPPPKNASKLINLELRRLGDQENVGMGM